jgi:hypothetical protein
MAAETMAFVDTFDAAFAIKYDLESMIGKFVPLLILTDSRPLFDVLICAKSAAREGFTRRDITNVCLIRSEYNVADAMTKLASNAALLHILKSNRVNHPIEQYVVDPLPPTGEPPVSATFLSSVIATLRQASQMQ